MLFGAVAWLGLLLLLLPSDDWRRSLYAGLVVLGICIELWGYGLLAQYLRFQFKRATLEAFFDDPDDASATERALNHQSLSRVGPLSIPELEPQGRWLHEVAVWGMAIAGSGIIGLNSMIMRCLDNEGGCQSWKTSAGLGVVFLLLQIALVVVIALLMQLHRKRLDRRHGLTVFRMTRRWPNSYAQDTTRTPETGLIIVAVAHGVILIPFLLAGSFNVATLEFGDAVTSVLALLLLRWLGGFLFKPIAQAQAHWFEPYQTEKFCTSCGQVAFTCDSEPLQTAFQERAFEQDPNERIAHELDNISYVGWRCEVCQPEDVLKAYYWQRLRSHDKTLCPECHHDTVHYQVKSDLVKFSDVHHERCRVCYYHNSTVVPRRRRRASSGSAGTTYYGPSEYSFSDAGSGGECGGGSSGGGDFGGGESGGGGAGESW